MKANTIKTKDGTEVYENMLYRLADEYIDSLDNPEDIKGNNKGVFTGMIKYIYMNFFRYHPVNYGDIESIDNIFNIYTSLCYKYNKRPTILNFSIMIDVSMETINSWKNENTRKCMYYDSENNIIDNILAWKNKHPGEEYRQESSSKHSETVKKWLKECESALLDGAVEQNGIGCIFALKANYGYTETAPIPVQNPHQLEQRTPEEIAQQYGKVYEKEKQFALPDVPD